ncbi:TPR-like protein [Anaeromyces robustus]|uniref:TPR-like protein n=1 Tax=Anaeromyces robustus TaxID=1754192 RepID=A0A1Y1WVC2_9FUNG|nr:TPR-like protein [Anaeromyces robustus]|eukprot:ORX77497.1 TPR-like protein [Anaeromyces robustus]
MEKIKKDLILKNIKDESYKKFEKGNEYFKSNEINKAISYYTRAIYLNDKEPAFYFQKAEAYMLTGQTDNAIINYMVCLKRIKNINDENKRIEELKKAKEEEEKRIMLEKEKLLLDEMFKNEENSKLLNDEKNKELEELNNIYNNITNFDKNTSDIEETFNKTKKLPRRKSIINKRKRRKSSVKNKKDVIVVKYDRNVTKNTETLKDENNNENVNNNNNNIENENSLNKKNNKKNKVNKKKRNSVIKYKRNSLIPKKESLKERKDSKNNEGINTRRKSFLKTTKKPVNIKSLEMTKSDYESEKEEEEEENNRKRNSITVEPYCNSPFVSNRLCKALFCSGQLYVDSGIFDEALICFNKILSIDKNFPYVNLILTCIYIEIQDREKALYYINECINNENDNANYYVIRAKFYQMNDEVSLVNKDRLKIIELCPDHPELDPINKYIINMTTYYKNRADEMVQKEHFDIAINFLNLAIELDPEDWILYFKRGLLLCDIEKYEESISDFENLLYEIDHDTDKDPIIREHLSTIYNQYATYEFRNGIIGKAIELLNQGMIYSPMNTVILRNLGDCYLTENYIDKALTEYKKFINEYKKKKMMTDEEKQEWIEVNKLCGIIISCYAYNYYRELNFEESINKFTEAISYYSFDVNFYIGRAKANFHLNNFVDTAEDLWVVLNLDPENKKAHSLLEQLENNFNTTGQQRIPAFHPQKILFNNRYLNK